MADSTEPAGTPVPAAPATPATPAAEPKAAPPSTAKAEPDEPKVGEPNWLNARIERAKKAGEKDAKKALKSERKAVQAAAQEAKAVKDAAALEVQAAKMAVEAILSEVPEDERAAVKAAGGASVAETLKAFSVWKATKQATAAKTPAPVEPPKAAVPPAPVQPPATTAPAGQAPPPAGQSAPEDFAATYRDLKASNPYLAAQFLVNNAEQVFPNLALKR